MKKNSVATGPVVALLAFILLGMFAAFPLRAENVLDFSKGYQFFVVEKGIKKEMGLSTGEEKKYQKEYKDFNEKSKEIGLSIRFLDEKISDDQALAYFADFKFVNKEVKKKKGCFILFIEKNEWACPIIGKQAQEFANRIILQSFEGVNEEGEPLLSPGLVLENASREMARQLEAEAR